MCGAVHMAMTAEPWLSLRCDSAKCKSLSQHLALAETGAGRSGRPAVPPCPLLAESGHNRL